MNYEKLETLVIKAKNGDKKSKEEIINEFKPFILKFSSKFFIDSYDIYDIQSECYTILLEAINMYKPEKHRFVAYATNAIKNTIFLLVRRSKRHDKTDGLSALTFDGELSHIVDENDDYQQILKKLDSEQLANALKSLNKKEFELIDFVIFKKQSLRSYSIIKKINYSTVVWDKNLILKKLKGYLTK